MSSLLNPTSNEICTLDKFSSNFRQILTLQEKEQKKGFLQLISEAVSETTIVL